jgi:hypothetical protein
LAKAFGKVAETISPGYSPFEYLWGALALRKYVSKGRHLSKTMNIRLASGVFTLRNRHGLPEGSAHYLITLGDTPFFVGFADILRDCKFFDSAPIQAAAEAMNHRVKSKDDITIRTRMLDIAAIRRTHGETTKTELRSACGEKLIERHCPIANIPRAA